MKRRRESWGSKLGFILATSGAAIGLGNIQRFPYITAQFGGAAFVLVYLLAVIFVGLPLILVEFAIGRHTKQNPIDAIEAIAPKTLWKWVGGLGILTSFFIFTYYGVVAGWAIGYLIQTFFGELIPISEFSKNPLYSIGCMVLFDLLAIFIVQRGVRKGIEYYSKLLMPLLFIVLICLVIRSLTLPGSMTGLEYYLWPNFSEINGKVFLYALSQAFFSLCVGEAVLMTYGSYAKKEENMVTSAVYIAIFDTLVALLSGLMIFPALFAFGEHPAQGVGLIFVVLPKIFESMPFGFLFGGLFFLLLSFAALTTSIALLEIPSSYLVDVKGWGRKRTVWTVGLLGMILGIPSALSKGASDFFTNLHLPFFHEKGFYEIMDFVWGGLAMVIGGMLLAIFVGWVWGIQKAREELEIGAPHFKKIGTLWGILVKYLAPLVTLYILFNLL